MIAGASGQTVWVRNILTAIPIFLIQLFILLSRTSKVQILSAICHSYRTIVLQIYPLQNMCPTGRNNNAGYPVTDHADLWS